MCSLGYAVDHSEQSILAHVGSRQSDLVGDLGKTSKTEIKIEHGLIRYPYTFLLLEVCELDPLECRIVQVCLGWSSRVACNASQSQGRGKSELTLLMESPCSRAA